MDEKGMKRAKTKNVFLQQKTSTRVVSLPRVLLPISISTLLSLSLGDISQCIAMIFVLVASIWYQ